MVFWVFKKNFFVFDVDIFKVFIEFVTVLLLYFVTILLLQYWVFFMFWFFGHEACGILATQPGIEPTPPALEGEVLTTGLPGKSCSYGFYPSIC